MHFPAQLPVILKGSSSPRVVGFCIVWGDFGEGLVEGDEFEFVVWCFLVAHDAADALEPLWDVGVGLEGVEFDAAAQVAEQVVCAVVCEGFALVLLEELVPSLEVGF
jgi:hypothetical protein